MKTSETNSNRSVTELPNQRVPEQVPQEPIPEFTPPEGDEADLDFLDITDLNVSIPESWLDLPDPRDNPPHYPNHKSNHEAARRRKILSRCASVRRFAIGKVIRIGSGCGFILWLLIKGGTALWLAWEAVKTFLARLGF